MYIMICTVIFNLSNICMSWRAGDVENHIGVQAFKILFKANVDKMCAYNMMSGNAFRDFERTGRLRYHSA